MSDELTESDYRELYRLVVDPPTRGWMARIWIENKISKGKMDVSPETQIDIQVLCNTMNQIYKDIFDFMNENNLINKR